VHQQQLGQLLSRAAVLGQPVMHSLSPVLHNAAYAALGLSGWSYIARECDAESLAGLVHAADDSWRGFSCTMPVKEAALAVADRRSSDAEVVGAANTLVRDAESGGWYADNTDIAGIMAAVQERVAVPQRLLVLGAGGTARAALAAAARWGMGEVSIAVRDPARAAAAVQAAQRLGLVAVVHTLGSAPAIAAAAEADLIVSTLPPGAADSCDDLPIGRGQAVLDVVYVPWPTALAVRAQGGGATVITGAAMLLHQAGDQVRLMTGLEPPLEAMRAALRAVVAAGVV
jgi:shikimate dehydrogenase